MSDTERTGPPSSGAETVDRDQRAADPSILPNVVTAIATLALAVVAVVELHGRQLEAAVVGLAVAAPIIFGLLPGSRKFRGWPLAGPLLIGLLAGLLAIAGFGWGNSHNHATSVGRSEPGHGLNSSQKQSPVKINISFLDPQSGQSVKQCPRIDGMGKIPSGYGLWIIVIPNTNMSPKLYWIESQAKNEGPDYWIATDSVSIDGPATAGLNADVYAVLIDRKWSNYFAVSSANGSFSATSLPPTVAGGIIGPVTVTRVSGTGTCR